MNHIEIHGFPPVAAEDVKKRVLDLFRGTPASSKIQVQIIPLCTDSQGEVFQFLRLYSSSLNIDGVIIRLRTLGLELQVMKIDYYYPAEAKPSPV